MKKDCFGREIFETSYGLRGEGNVQMGEELDKLAGAGTSEKLFNMAALFAEGQNGEERQIYGRGNREKRAANDELRQTFL